METVFSDGCGLVLREQQDWGVDLASKFSRSQSKSLIHGGPTSQLTGLKGSGANILVPDTTAHLQGSSGVHALMVQGCFGSKGGDQHSIRLVVIMVCLIGVYQLLFMGLIVFKFLSIVFWIKSFLSVRLLPGSTESRGEHYFHLVCDWWTDWEGSWLISELYRRGVALVTLIIMSNELQGCKNH